MGACTTSKPRANESDKTGTVAKASVVAGNEIQPTDSRTKLHGNSLGFSIGPEIFISLKNGSIDSEYKKFHILGEGNQPAARQST